jgi:uncharacterized repeat protein (TIGR01451 family)
MIGLLSTISGQFTKNLILGSFLPVVVFVALSMILVVPIFPADWPLLKPFLGFGIEGKAIALTFITIVMTGLLFNLNTQVLRLYEGYPWINSWIGRLMIRKKQEEFAHARARRLGIRTLLREMPRDDTRYVALSSKQHRATLGLINEFPSQKHLIVPTRLGNVMRSFEEYPSLQYGIGAITLWPRLVAKIDKDYAAGLDDAKTSLDFMLNSSVLSFLSATLVSTAGWYYYPASSLFYAPGQASIKAIILTWLITIIGFSTLGFLAYLSAIERAGAWGTKVKGAFDLYRGELLKQFGYERANLTLNEERYLWDSISRQLIYGDPPWGRDPLVECRLNKAFARGRAPFVDLEVARGVRPEADGGLTITIRVRNTDSKKAARRVLLVDTLPSDFNYVWGSASNGNSSPRVTGTNPYWFEMGDMKASEEVTLTYLAVPQSGK